MKKPTKRTAQPLRPRDDGPDVELRRWCVEQAMRWPSAANPAYAGQGGIQAMYQKNDQDVIGRAKQLHDWVTTRS